MAHVAEKFVDRLMAHGVRYAFGIPGGPWIPYIEAMRRRGMPFILTANEASAGFMADVCFRLTGQLALCHGTFGPGATNLATGVGGALLDRSALIAATTEQSDAMRHRVTQMNIDCGMNGVAMTKRPIVFFALHKGDDTFMSEKQYLKFYWPAFRKVILGLIEEGVVPLLFAEGRYDNRLEIIKDLPRGKVVWHFDQTDMFRAKKVLGDNACIAGNVPASLLCTATPKDVKEYCRKLIEVCGEGGGFILTGGASVDKCDPGNLHAMTEAVMEYGVY